jgi:hypothetical protein
MYTSNLQPVEININVYIKFNINSENFKNTTPGNYNIINFYYDFGDNWQEHFKNIILNIVKNNIAKYDTNFLFGNRSDFKSALSQNIQNYIKSYSNNLLTVYSVNILNISIDNKLEQAIEDKLIQYQKIKIFSINSELTYINKTTERLIKQINSDIELVNQDAHSYSKIRKVMTNSNCLNTIMQSDANSYGDLDNNLSLSSDGSLINFIGVLEENILSSPRRVFNYDSSSIFNK